MASPTPPYSHYSPNVLQLPIHSPQFRLILAGISLSRSKHDFSRRLLVWQQQQQQQRSWDPLRRVGAKEVAAKCFGETAEERESAGEVVLDKEEDDEISVEEVISKEYSNGAAVSQRVPSSGDSLSLGIREPVYEREKELRVKKGFGRDPRGVEKIFRRPYRRFSTAAGGS